MLALAAEQLSRQRLALRDRQRREVEREATVPRLREGGLAFEQLGTGRAEDQDWRGGVLEGAYQPPAQILLADEFSKTNVPVQVNPVPQALCLPAEKVIHTANGDKDYPIINAKLHLLCFPTIKTPQPNFVWTKNQFGSAKMTIQHDSVETLCLPSTKDVVGPQG